MDTGKLVVLLAAALLTAGMITGYTGDGSTGGSGSDGSGSGSGSGDDGAYSGFSGVDFECNNTQSGDPGGTPVDDDSDGRANLGPDRDYGCVKPAGLDNIEGNGWDTDLTSAFLDIDEVMSQPAIEQDPTVFFDGQVKLGGDQLSDDYPDDSSSGLTERYLKDAQDEPPEGDYGKGVLKSRGYTDSDFAPGTVVKNGRVVDPPTGTSGSRVVGSRESCGDGRLNDGEVKPAAVDIMKEDSFSNAIGCTEDYGLLKTEYRIRPSGDGVYNEDNEDNLRCESDNLRTKSNSCGVTDTACDDPWNDDLSGSWKDENKGPGGPNTRDNLYFEKVNGEQGIKRWDCGATDNAFSYQAEDYETVCVETDKNGDCTETEQVCDPSTQNACTSRSWNTNIWNCNGNNLVTGGGEGERVTPSYYDKPDNDQAGTYTDFRAYGSEARGSSGEVWCQFERTLTVDADGPNGNGDGWVLINETASSPVVGTVSPDGSDSVGKSIWTRESTPDSNGDFTPSGVTMHDFSKTCPGDKTVCLKYVDYRTEQTRAAWGHDGVDLAVNSNTIEQAVETRVVKTLTADESYSVCKKMNSISEAQGQGEIADCDYERKGQDISPLTVACGDQKEEHLILFEGPEADYPAVSEFLIYNQMCVDYSGSGGHVGTQTGLPVTQNACVYQDSVYREGAVINIGEGYRGAESGGLSPDFEVCLNLANEQDFQKWDNADNSNSRRDYGGEWYDLDSDAVNQRIQQLDLSDRTVSLFATTNPNPQHDSYNPTGGKTGLSLEDDCGNPDFAGGSLECEDTGENTERFYTFFSSGVLPGQTS
ncbi:MAG: hypothetical protein ABEJ64_02425 [Candidatus Nanohaloarchaea archaeon]